MKQIGAIGGNWKAPDISKSLNYSYTPSKFKQNKYLTPSNLDTSMFPSLYEEKSSDKEDKGGIKAPNVWDILSGTFGQLGGAVTNTFANMIDDIQDKDKPLWQDITQGIIENNPLGFIGKGAGQFMHNIADGKLNKHDIPFYDMFTDKGIDNQSGFSVNKSISQGLKDGAKAQYKDWADGKWNWGDIPGAGFLNGMDKKWQRGEDIMSKLGADNKWTKVGGGLALDIALDPLTYLTLGANAATKAGKAAELRKLKEIQKSLNLDKKIKNSTQLEKALTEKLSEKVTIATKAEENKRIASIMRSYKITTPVRNADDLLMEVEKILTKKYPNSPNVIQKKLDGISETLRSSGQKHIKEMQTKIDDILDEVKTTRNKVYNANINSYGLSIPFGNKIAIGGKMTEKFNPLYATEAKLGSQYRHLADDLIEKVAKGNQVYERRLIEAINDRYDVKSVEELTKTQFADLTNFVKDFKKTTNFKKTGVANVKTKKYNEISNAKTAMGHWADKAFGAVNARSLGTGDKFLDSMAEIIADADSQRIGDYSSYKSVMNDVEKYIKKNNITPKEMNEVIYHIEKKAPESYGANWEASERVQKLAGKIRPLIDRVTKEELESGVLTKARENYFPHIINKSDADIEKINKFLDENPNFLPNRKATSGNDKKRTSFQTLADRDDFIEKLSKAIQKEKDPTKKAELQEQLDRAANLFDTNITSALTRRVKEGVRAKAMKEMGKELKRFGMYTKGEEADKVPIGMRKLTPDEVKKLGLGEGTHYMHPDVFEGLKRVDDIFTNQGMNKYVRHLSAMTDIWKNLVTSYKISHYRNNIIGNTFTNLAAGVTVSDYRLAKKMIKDYRSGKLSPAQKKIMDEAFKKNVMSGGYISDQEFNFHFDNPTELEKLSHKVGNFKPVKKGKEIGEYIDDHFRLANYLNGLNKYGDSKKAAQQVRKYLFNYNELTSVDRGIKVAVPFWNWTKRNVPLQIQLLLEQPKYATSIQKFQEAINDNREGADWQKENSVAVPKWMTEPFTDKEYYTSLSSPTADLKTVSDPAALLGSMNPVFKMGIETAMNKQFYNGQPISYGTKDNAILPEDLFRYLMRQGGVTGNLYDAGAQRRTLPESIVNYVNPISRVKEE